MEHLHNFCFAVDLQNNFLRNSAGSDWKIFSLKSERLLIEVCLCKDLTNDAASPSITNLDHEASSINPLRSVYIKPSNDRVSMSRILLGRPFVASFMEAVASETS